VEDEEENRYCSIDEVLEAEVRPDLGEARPEWRGGEHCTALHCTALHCTALHCTALHCTALHCTALHCTLVPRYA
jgi:hypothetical protein